MGDSDDQAVMFDTAFHSLEKSLGKRLDPALRAAFRRLGIDFEHLAPAYPIERWEEGLGLLCRTLHAGRSKEDAWRRIGQEFLEGYTQTTLGQATLVMGKVLGVRRMLHRMERNFRTASNASRISVADLGPQRLEITISMEPRFVPRWQGLELSLPHHRLGILEGTLKVLGATGTVELLTIDRQLQRSAYLVAWQ